MITAGRIEEAPAWALIGIAAPVESLRAAAQLVCAIEKSQYH